MKIDEVPQEVSPNYDGHRRLVYAVSGDGEYRGVHTDGWDVESAATLAAIAEVERLRTDAWQRAEAGAASPLEFHMYTRRMDLALLAGAAGMWQWRVRRHFDPRRFARLKPSVLARYAQALQISSAMLSVLPESPEQ
jgi:hypothetical protein